MMKTIEKEIFSAEELAVIQKCIDLGMYDSVPSALESAGFLELTPEKAAELQVILDKARPVTTNQEESVVLHELRMKELKEGYRIETKEQQAEWQARLDAERTGLPIPEVKENVEEEKEPIEMGDEDSAAAASVDDPNEIILTKAEIIAELTKKNIEFKPNQSKAELVDLLARS